jgi:hypothetical protein
MVSPTIAPEIANSLHWTDSLVDALKWLGELPPPGDRAPSQRTRLRKFLNLLNHYMGRHPELQKLAFRDDIATLGVALDAPNFGATHPLLATQRFNKLPDNKIEQQFRAYAISFVHILVAAGIKERTPTRWLPPNLLRPASGRNDLLRRTRRPISGPIPSRSGTVLPNQMLSAVP